MESAEEISPTKSPLWLRAVGIMIGFLCLVWLPFEDTNISFISGLAVAICAWTATRMVLHSKTQLARHTIVGTLTGSAIVPTMLILMAVKSGLHTHGFSDFQALQVKQVIASFPYWTLGGLLLGVIIGFSRKYSARATSEENEKSNKLL